MKLSDWRAEEYPEATWQTYRTEPTRMQQLEEMRTELEVIADPLFSECYEAVRRGVMTLKDCELVYDLAKEVARERVRSNGQTVSTGTANPS